MFVYLKRNNNFTPIFFVRFVATQFTTESSNTKSNRYKNKKNCHKNFNHPFFIHSSPKLSFCNCLYFTISRKFCSIPHLFVKIHNPPVVLTFIVIR